MTNDNAIINFAYFAANFQHNFIDECWKDEPYLISHLTEKFLSNANGICMDAGGFVKFFFELDRNNQRKLSRWITENYCALPDLK